MKVIGRKAGVAISLLFRSDPLVLLRVSKGFNDGCGDGALLSIVFTCTSGYTMDDVVTVSMIISLHKSLSHLTPENHLWLP